MKPLRAGRQSFSISYGGWITSVLIDDRAGNDIKQTELLSSVNIGFMFRYSTTQWFNSFTDVYFSIYIICRYIN